MHNGKIILNFIALGISDIFNKCSVSDEACGPLVANSTERMQYTVIEIEFEFP